MSEVFENQLISSPTPALPSVTNTTSPKSVAQFLSDPKFQKDLVRLNAELIFEIDDIKLITDPRDWEQLALTPEAKEILISAANSSIKSGAVPSEPSEPKQVKTLVTDPAQLKILLDQLIVDTVDIELLKDEDWKQLKAAGLSDDSHHALLIAIGNPGVFSIEPSEISQYLKDEKFSTDLLILDNEMIYTLEDVYRLTDEDWAELQDKRLIPAAKAALLAALPPAPVPLVGRPTRQTPVSSIIHEKVYFRDRKKLADNGLKLMNHAMDINAVSALQVTPSAIQKIEQAIAMILEDEKPKQSADPVYNIDNCFDQYYERDLNKNVGKCKILKKRIAVLDRAIRCSHRIALKAEIDAIRRAEEVAKLTQLKRQLMC